MGSLSNSVPPANMPPKKEQKSKEAKAKAAMSGGKGKKKKWSKGKVKEKLNNAVLLDKGVYKKLVNDIPKSRVITTAVVSERLKINGSIARAALQHLTEKGLIRQVSAHGSMRIYTRATHE